MRPAGGGNTGRRLADVGIQPHPPQTLNLRCARCRYELRCGLDPDGRCPECGKEIAETLDANRRRCGRVLARARRMHAPPLAPGDRRWLVLTSAGLVALALVHAGLVAWYVAWVRDGSYRRWKTPDHQLFWISLGYAAAAWLLTSRRREAGAQEQLKRRPLRWSLRTLSVAPPLAAAMGLVSELVPFQSHVPWARLALVPALAVPAVVYLTFDWTACLAALARCRGSVVAFHVTRLLATVFTAAMVALGAASGQRVAEITASCMEALAAPAGLGLVLLAGVTVLLLRLAWKLASAAPRAPTVSAAPSR